MQGLHIRARDGKPIAEATDGTILAQCEIPEQEEGEKILDGAILGAKSLKAAAKMLPKATRYKAAGMMDIKNDDGPTLAHIDGAQVTIERLDGGGQNFPNTEAILTFPERPVIELALSPTLLAKLAGMANKRVILRIYGSNKPIRFECDGEREIKGVVMPWALLPSDRTPEPEEPVTAETETVSEEQGALKTVKESFAAGWTWGRETGEVLSQREAEERFQDCCLDAVIEGSIDGVANDHTRLDGGEEGRP